MRFLDHLNEWGYSSRSHSSQGSGSGKASDFPLRYRNWLASELRYYGDDPIIREHFATWLAKILEIPDGKEWVDKIITSPKLFSAVNTPKLQQRHYWFIADNLKAIENPYMWKYAFDFFWKLLKDEGGFKGDLFKKAATP